jgi:hypothetical protein
VVVAASVSLRNIGPQFFHLRFQKFIGHGELFTSELIAAHRHISDWNCKPYG